MATVPGELGRGGAETPEDRHGDSNKTDDAKEISHKAVAEIEHAFQEGVLASYLENERKVVIERKQNSD